MMMKSILMLLVFSRLVASSATEASNSRIEESEKVAKASAVGWEEMIKKYPVKNNWKLEQRGYQVPTTSTGPGQQLVLTIVCYVTSDNLIVLALALAEHQEAKQEEPVRLKYYLLGKPCLIQDTDKEPPPAGRTGKIISALRVEHILGLFQTDDQKALALRESVTALDGAK